MQLSKQPKVAILKAEWDGIAVEYGCLEAAGEFDFAMPKHALSVAFTPHDRVTWSVDGGKRQTSTLPAGSVFLYSDREFVWHRREHESVLSKLLWELHRIAMLPKDGWNALRCCCQ